MLVPAESSHDLGNQTILVPAGSSHDLGNQTILVPAGSSHDLGNQTILVPAGSSHDLGNQTILVPVGSSHDLGNQIDREPKGQVVKMCPGRARDSDDRRDDRRSNPRHDKSRSEKRGKNSSSSAPSQSWKERGSKPSFQQATRGIDSDVIEQRRRNGDCLKCGKPGHSWAECRSGNRDSRDGQSRSGSDFKRKGDDGDSRGSSYKKSKPAAAAAAVTSEPGRIIEIPEDEADDLDFDIWA
jgi:hypothetical protein